MRTIVRVIDAISEWTGKATRWLCVALVGVMTFEVIMRYVFNAPTIWAPETSMMLGATIFAVGWAYIHRHQAHVRVDVIYRLLSPRQRAIIDVVFTLLFLFPFVIILTYYAADKMWQSWAIGEKMIETYWYPPAGPLRTVVFLGFFFLALQSVAGFIRDLYLLVRNKPYD